jgi:hypothetical protein
MHISVNTNQSTLNTCLGDSKELHSCFAPGYGTLLAFNLLKAKIVVLGIEVFQVWSRPSLILLRVIVLESRHVLGHLLQNL